MFSRAVGAVRRRRVVGTAAIRVRRRARLGLGHGRDDLDLVLERTRRTRLDGLVDGRLHVVVVGGRRRGGIRRVRRRASRRARCRQLRGRLVLAEHGIFVVAENRHDLVLHEHPRRLQTVRKMENSALATNQTWRFTLHWYTVDETPGERPV